MLEVQITIRDIPNSLAVENHIREKAQKLNHYSQEILSCRVVLEVPQKHKHQGKLYSIRIEVAVPGNELVVNRKQNEDVYIAIRDAFHAVERQLESYTRRKQGAIKTHDSLNRGKIVRIFAEDGFGFIKGYEGDEYYFNESSVKFPKFHKLMVGDIVQFIMVIASEGLQAKRVTRVKQAYSRGSYII